MKNKCEYSVKKFKMLTKTTWIVTKLVLKTLTYLQESALSTIVHLHIHIYNGNLMECLKSNCVQQMFTEGQEKKKKKHELIS